MTAPEQYIEITGPLLGELPEHYCTPCGWPVFMHDDGKPCEHVHDLNLVEVRMSDCEFGCKVWRCESCGEEMVLHSATYGCPGAA